MKNTDATLLDNLALTVLVILILTTGYYYNAYQKMHFAPGSKIKTDTSSTTPDIVPADTVHMIPKGAIPKTVKTAILTDEQKCTALSPLLNTKIIDKTKAGYSGFSLIPADIVIGYSNIAHKCIGGFSAKVESISSSTQKLPQMYFIVEVTSDAILSINWSKEGTSFSLDREEYLEIGRAHV